MYDIKSFLKIAFIAVECPTILTNHYKSMLIINILLLMMKY